MENRKPCPNCGHCPTCGHSPQQTLPWYPPYPWAVPFSPAPVYPDPVIQPYITWGGGTEYTTTATLEVTSC